MSVWSCVSSEIDWPFVHCNEKVEYEDLSVLVWRSDGQPFPEPGPSLVIWHRPFSQLYFAERFECWVHGCSFELRLRRNRWGIFAG